VFLLSAFRLDCTKSNVALQGSRKSNTSLGVGGGEGQRVDVLLLGWLACDIPVALLLILLQMF
jgi:hypothetical protein